MGRMLPAVDFCGLRVTRLILGGNPFAGFSHQTPQRDEAMRQYYSIDRILETWERAESAGINTMVTNNETPHVVEAVWRYLGAGGRLQWIAQVNCRLQPDMRTAIDEVVRLGCRALYFHGARVDEAYCRRDERTLRGWFEHARAARIPVGVAAHDPDAHLWVSRLGLADFHAVCGFRCGSVHEGAGERFRLGDLFRAMDVIRRLPRPCIAYKVLGAGRIDARMAFEYAFENIKPDDVINVGMFRGDRDSMVEENVALVRDILSRADSSRCAS